MSVNQPDDCAEWADLVRRISNGDEDGAEQLYLVSMALIRNTLWRVAGIDSFDDHLHEILLIVLESIRGGRLRDPSKLPGFIRTVARRRIIAHIRGRAAARRRLAMAAESVRPPSQEDRISDLERAARLRAALGRLSARDREIIERFYFQEQPVEQICGEMNLTGTQFRLYKSRALARCSEFVSRPALSGLRIA